ncbi:hypothetical protein ILUMI_21109 [Ignelater luminosus]|uniref:KIF-binding protein n=1 Tax=Ignelater luminosus TaxID=2038154 RepID=A0A8K0CD23_IGNLU|nr:hypothetical protein ILUMI_21109 [Ignelater luminosus]
MTITKEAYVDLLEKYEKVKKLIEEDSKSDPENEPYLSKYIAKPLLIGMKANIENLLRNRTPETKEYIKLTAMLGVTLLNLGKISVETEEISVGEKYLTKCQEVIEKYETHPEFIITSLRTYNEIGLIWWKREVEKAKVYLEKAETLYKQFKETGLIPVDLHDLFKIDIPGYDEDVGKTNFEKDHTLTLYYLAQIYGALNDSLKSAVYCHITLQRQLESDDYEMIDWALNAATLSQFFMEKNGFKQARHHLAASSYMLEIYEGQLNQITDQNEYEAKIENFKHRSADVARCWAKYGLLLLSNSRERLLKHTEDIDATCSLSPDLAKLELNADSSVSREDLASLEFPTLNVAVHESQVTDQFVLTLDDARKVFLNVKMWLNRAHSYYTLNNLASDYIEIVQDQAQMYLNLSFFEDNPENQAKMHKRRADLLENVLKEVNPTYYMQYCRQMWYELAQSYGEILHIKMDKLKESNGRPTPHTLTKINSLVDKGILHYNNFINSFKDVSTNQIPRTIDKDYQKPLLQAYFHIGALYSRYITLDKQVMLNNVKASLEAYKKVTEYCVHNVDADKLIPTEVSICREMITLLPMKINKLEHEIL